MIAVHSIADMRAERARMDARNGRPQRVGLVPTMGYLHAGHAAVIRRARAECGHVVVSIFVNPLQFGPNEDFARYPRDLARDRAVCEEAGADAVFAPSVQEMYGRDGAATVVHVRGLGDHLCGASRPGHFDGVCTVVAKLLQIVQPARAYFGRKDAQQWRIVRRMAQDLSIPAEIVPCETVREEDGLAMSSRNAYLNPRERRAAPAIWQTLSWVREQVLAGRRDAPALREEALLRLAAEPLLRPDYLSFVDDESLQPTDRLAAGRRTLCAAAAFIGSTRLIDNVELDT